MRTLSYIVTFWLSLLWASHAFADNHEYQSSQNLIFKEFNLFEFILENYTYISYDLISEEGDFLNVLYKYAPTKTQNELLFALRLQLADAKSIAEFSRAAVEIIGAKVT